MKSHRAFPPGRGNLKIPISTRHAAHAGLALYAPCRPKGRFARWIGWRTVDLLGPRALPGKPTQWKPPMEAEVWRALSAEWSKSVGPFDEVAAYERIQASRRGFAALLLSNGNPVGFVKARDGEQAPLANEFEALSSVSSSEPRWFEIPHPIAIGAVEGWHYLLTSALEPDIHHVPIDPRLSDVIAEIQSGLQALPRPADTPHHWEPMHGDFTPWNLRERRDGRLFLIDWEDAGWAPPGADEVYYLATMAALGEAARPAKVASEEAVDFWVKIVDGRLEKAQMAGDLDISHAQAVRRSLKGAR